MKKLAICFALLWATPAMAAAPICNVDLKAFYEVASAQYGEIPIVSFDGPDKIRFYMTGNPKTGTWSMALTDPHNEGKICITDDGKGLKVGG